MDEQAEPAAKRARLQLSSSSSSAPVPPQAEDSSVIKCPYLDTINRHLLDFDFDKVCSQTLSALNVYGCLVCGKFFSGRGKQTQAYTHSTMTGHHMFINLDTCRIYCLPDNYEVIDSSLDDIKRCVAPTFSVRELQLLDSNTTLARDVHGVAYLPGFCGLNNLKRTDYANVVVHALAHVTPLRDYFLANSDPSLVAASRRYPLVRKFGELLRKMWSKDNFKSVISPHGFVQEVSVASKRRFVIGRQADAVDFLSWLLNTLEKQLHPSSIVDRAFRGAILVETLSRRTHLTRRDEDHDETAEEQGWRRTVAETKFLYLTLDIPPTPLFKDSQGGNVIPQIPLFDVLAKYNGVKLTDSVKAGLQSRKRYVLKHLPPFLVFHFGRFSKNNFYNEKNPTIVNFPVYNLDLADQFAFDPQPPPGTTKYDLVANVCHDLPAGLGKDAQQDPLQFGTYRVHLRQPSSNQWYEIQDLHVSETMPQLIGLSESLLCVYVRRDSGGAAAT